jgi:hypothetical protein
MTEPTIEEQIAAVQVAFDNTEDAPDGWFDAIRAAIATLESVSALRERVERLVAAAYEDAKISAANPFLYEEDDGPLDLQRKIGQAIDYRKKIALAALDDSTSGETR